MKYTLATLSLTISVTATAASPEQPLSKTYNCSSKGCSVTCLNIKNNWTTISGNAGKVKVNHYANGNIDFVLQNIKNINGGSRDDEIIFISNKNLKCKLSGIKPK